ncbi:hypothetical protein [Streptomyces sp. NPDC001492]
MPTEVIDALADMSVEQALSLAVGLFGSAACACLLLIDAHIDPDTATGRAIATAHQTAVHARHDLNRWAAIAWLHTRKGVLLARIALVALLLIAAAYFAPADSASKESVR